MDEALLAYLDGDMPGAAKPPRPGLVPLSTSATPPESAPQRAAQPAPDGTTQFVIDPAQGRIRRMRSSILTGARLIQERMANSGQRWKPAFLHLTYADQDAFDARQISGLIDRIRKWAKRRDLPPLPFIWVLERGSRHGRLHYHLMIWLPKGVTLPKPDKQGWWPWGSTRIEWARSAVRYMAKYASKGGKDTDQPFPKGARIHGKGGLTGTERSQCAWWRAPTWVKHVWPDWQDEPRPAVGGGWISRVTGDWLPSPWMLIGFELGRPVVRWIADRPCPFAAA
ncbi:replication initiation protein [Marichromatium sp. PS1]